MFAQPSQCTFVEHFLIRYSSVCILNLIRVLKLSGVFVAFDALIALNLSFLHYITLRIAVA